MSQYRNFFLVGFTLLYIQSGFASILHPRLEALVKHSIGKPTKLEFELSFEGFPNHKIREVWWFKSAEQFKIQTLSVDSDWLYWETLFKAQKRHGPLAEQVESVKASPILSEQIFFITSVTALTEAFRSHFIQYSESQLSRQQGRVAIKFASAEKSSEAALWLDQNQGELSRILSTSGCDVTYHLSNQLSQYPKNKVLRWLNFKAESITVTKADITKFDPSFFELLSGKFQESPSNTETLDFLNHLKQFYRLCR